MRLTLPDDVLVCIAEHLTDFGDLQNFDRAFFPRISGLYASLGRGKVRLALQPLLPAVRTMHTEHPAIAARELPCHLPNWDIRFLLHLGAPNVALTSLSFAEVDTMCRQLVALPVVAKSPLLRQLGDYADKEFFSILFRAKEQLYDYHVRSDTRQNLTPASLEMLSVLLESTKARFGPRTELLFLDTLVRLTDVVSRQNMVDLSAGQLLELQESMSRSAYEIFRAGRALGAKLEATPRLRVLTGC